MYTNKDFNIGFGDEANRTQLRYYFDNGVKITMKNNKNRKILIRCYAHSCAIW